MLYQSDLKIVLLNMQRMKWDAKEIADTGLIKSLYHMTDKDLSNSEAMKYC